MRIGRSLKPFRHPLPWAVVWMLGIAAVVVLSLVPPKDMPPEPLGSDKLGHFLAYACVMAWSVQIHARRRSWTANALLLVLLGIGLEFMQGAMHVGRSQDPMDALADTLGVIGGFATCLTPMRDALLRLDRRAWRP